MDLYIKDWNGVRGSPHGVTKGFLNFSIHMGHSNAEASGDMRRKERDGQPSFVLDLDGGDYDEGLYN